MNVLKKITKYPLVLIVGICMIVALSGYLFMPETEFSDMENRYLQGRPKVSVSSLLDGSFMSSFETYTNEQVIFRTGLVKAKSVMEMLALKCENNGIAKGRENHLFDKTLETDTQFAKNIQMIDKFIKDSGRDVTVAFAPTSVYANRDLLPEGMPVLDEVSMNSDAFRLLGSNDSAKVVNLFEVIDEHEGEDLYYHTDHHWRTGTAYYAYEKICREMNIDAVDITTLEKESADGFYGTFYAKYKGVGIQADSIDFYDVPIKSYETDDGIYDSLLDRSKLDTYDKYAMFMRGNYGISTVTADNAGNGKTLLLFKDSYANCLTPFFAYNYDTIVYVDLRYFGGSVAELMKEYQDADVLLMYNYSFLNDDRHFFKLLK